MFRIDDVTIPLLFVIPVSKREAPAQFKLIFFFIKKDVWSKMIDQAMIKKPWEGELKVMLHNLYAPSPLLNF